MTHQSGREGKKKTHVLDEHEALGVGDNLGSVQGLLKVVDESLLVALELGSRTAQDGAGAATLILESTEAAREDSLTDQGDGHAEVQSIDGGPLAGTLLASLVEDLVNKGSAIVVVVVEDITGDLDQEGVKNTGVPLGENITNLLGGETDTALEDIVGLNDDVSGLPENVLLESSLTSQISCMSPYSIPL